MARKRLGIWATGWLLAIAAFTRAQEQAWCDKTPLEMAYLQVQVKDEDSIAAVGAATGADAGQTKILTQILQRAVCRTDKAGKRASANVLRRSGMLARNNGTIAKGRITCAIWNGTSKK